MGQTLYVYQMKNAIPIFYKHNGYDLFTKTFLAR